MTRALLGLVALAALTLGACAAPPQVIERQVPVRVPVEVRVNVPVPCVKRDDVPAAPAAMSDQALDALTDYQLVLTIEQQRRELRIYEARVATLIARCMQPNVPLRGATQ